MKRVKLFLALLLWGVVPLLNQAVANQAFQTSSVTELTYSGNASSSAATEIRYKDSGSIKVSFVKTLVVFLLMIGLAYGSIVLIKRIQNGGLSIKSQNSNLISVLESRKLDVKTYIHAVEFSGQKLLVVQNGQTIKIQAISARQKGVGDESP